MTMLVAALDRAQSAKIVLLDVHIVATPRTNRDGGGAHFNSCSHIVLRETSGGIAPPPHHSQAWEIT